MDKFSEIRKTHNVFPSDVELENAILGSLIIESSVFSEINGFINQSDFYLMKNHIIFECIKKLHDKSSPIDLLTVINQLRSDGELDNVGGAYYVSSLTNRVSSASNIEYHARILKQLSIKRSLIVLGDVISKKGQDDEVDCFDLIDEVNLSILKIGEIDKKPPTMFQLVGNFMKEEELMASGGTNRNLTSFKKIDDITGGFGETDLVILAARPAMGKTSLAMNIAVNIAGNNNPVGVFSLEMDASQLIRRMVSAESGRNNKRGFSFGELSDARVIRQNVSIIQKHASSISTLPIHIIDKGGMSVQELRSKAIIMKKNHDVKVIIIDYLQLMSDGQKFSTKNTEVGNISRALKSLAKELKVTIVALSQLSREVEKRSDKTPLLSDLRDSGSIEQDADMVIFLTRPEYYGITHDENGECLKGKAKVVVAKNRNGSTNADWMSFDKRLTSFSDE